MGFLAKARKSARSGQASGTSAHRVLPSEEFQATGGSDGRIESGETGEALRGLEQAKATAAWVQAEAEAEASQLIADAARRLAEVRRAAIAQRDAAQPLVQALLEAADSLSQAWSAFDAQLEASIALTPTQSLLPK